MRPGQREMRALPVLEARRDALEKCVFCPKLCRSACPVSNAEPRETITPWGKMSMAYFAAHGDVPLDHAHAAPAWACTGCFACRGACDHRNDVAGTLLDARAALVSSGAAPNGALRTIARFREHEETTRAAMREIVRDAGVAHGGTRDAVLVGCGYARGAAAEARDVLRAASALVGAPIAPVEECCGLPLLLAGDARAFEQRASAFAREVQKAERVIVADAGCALALRVRYPEHGVALAPRVELLVELAAARLADLRPVESGQDAVRWHDPCQLGRGLGVYEPPRAVLTRLLGRAPDEFVHRRDWAACSGAGGLLPATMPGTARAIAHARAAEHEGAGGGTIVTACASSLRSLRATGAKVDDLATWIARSLAR